jgi:hypothetical protein
MTENAPRDIVLEYLRRIDVRTQNIQLDVDELKSLANIHRNDIANLKRESDHFYQLFARLTDRLERIEKRLELRDPWAAVANDPVLIAYTVTDRAGAKSFWRRIGVAFPHDKGAGLTVLLDALPMDGRLVLIEPRADLDRITLLPPPVGVRAGGWNQASRGSREQADTLSTQVQASSATKKKYMRDQYSSGKASGALFGPRMRVRKSDAVSFSSSRLARCWYKLASMKTIVESKPRKVSISAPTPGVRAVSKVLMT